jgi:hypothetical protein
MHYIDDTLMLLFLCMTAPWVNFAYKKNQMSTDRESGRGNKRARVTGTMGKANKNLNLFLLFSTFCLVASTAFSCKNCFSIYFSSTPAL